MRFICFVIGFCLSLRCILAELHVSLGKDEAGKARLLVTGVLRNRRPNYPKSTCGPPEASIYPTDSVKQPRPIKESWEFIFLGGPSGVTVSDETGAKTTKIKFRLKDARLISPSKQKEETKPLSWIEEQLRTAANTGFFYIFLDRFKRKYSIALQEWESVPNGRVIDKISIAPPALHLVAKSDKAGELCFTAGPTATPIYVGDVIKITDKDGKIRELEYIGLYELYGARNTAAFKKGPVGTEVTPEAERKKLTTATQAKLMKQLSLLSFDEIMQQIRSSNKFVVQHRDPKDKSSVTVTPDGVVAADTATQRSDYPYVYYSPHDQAPSQADPLLMLMLLIASLMVAMCIGLHCCVAAGFFGFMAGRSFHTNSKMKQYRPIQQADDSEHV